MDITLLYIKLLMTRTAWRWCTYAENLDIIVAYHDSLDVALLVAAGCG